MRRPRGNRARRYTALGDRTTRTGRVFEALESLFPVALAERAEYGHGALAQSSGGFVHQDIGQSTPDKIPDAGLLLGQVNRRLSAAYMFGVIHYVVARQDHPWSNISQGDVKNRASGKE